MINAILTRSEVLVPTGDAWDTLASRAEADGVHIRFHGDSVDVALSIVLCPHRYPWIFPDPTLERSLLLGQAHDWVAAHPALKQLYPSGFRVVWFA